MKIKLHPNFLDYCKKIIKKYCHRFLIRAHTNEKETGRLAWCMWLHIFISLFKEIGALNFVLSSHQSFFNEWLSDDQPCILLDETLWGWPTLLQHLTITPFNTLPLVQYLIRPWVQAKRAGLVMVGRWIRQCKHSMPRLGDLSKLTILFRSNLKFLYPMVSHPQSAVQSYYKVCGWSYWIGHVILPPSHWHSAHQWFPNQESMG